MCQAEEPASLESYAGLQICPSCRTEDFRPGLKAWGLKLYTYDEEKGSNKHRRREYNASAVLPTILDLGDAGAVMRAERFDTKIRRFFGKTDPSMGRDAFDKAVWVERIEGDLSEQLLSDPSVQDAAVVAVRAAHWVHINAHRVRLGCTSTTLGFDPATDLEPMRWAATALGIAMERWARRGPHGTDLRERCRPRTEGEWPEPLHISSFYIFE